ncbi:hypothetical protein [Cohnella sp.]|uniref:hypothetical protein n=1 Tax=Cohnella sp. TaxID=1883426 RepID=UPI003566399E
MKRPTTLEGSYLFQVEISISATNKGAALEHLLRVLNSGEFVDYRIGSGIQKETISIKAPSQLEALNNQIEQYIQSNKLLRLNVNKGLGVKMDIPCRIINFDADKQLITVYHVDEKQVYSFELNEIDDFLD